MNFDIQYLLSGFYSIGSILLGYLIVFFIANYIYSKKIKYDLKHEIVDNDNNAAAISLAGYLMAISIIFIGGTIGPSNGVVQDFIAIMSYSFLGIALLYIAHLINDKLILSQFSNAKEIVEDHNVGTGAVQAGSYIASALIIAGATHGEGGGLITTIVFFLLGQTSLILFTRIYNIVTNFDLHDEIENDNFAAGIAFSGTLVALGIILSNASSGNFISWEHNGLIFVINMLSAFILLPIFRVVIDKLIIVNIDLNNEIAIDKNIGAGCIECASTIAFACVLFFAI
ncbi:MAG: uncharacterized membrane protein YjfL (UPF0719 family) [Candidatus Endobugula sp.]|jgi:uncharacterized membrane protein YjfL (UPF0719 family)